MSYINKEELIRRMQVCAPMNWTDTDFELGEESQYKSDMLHIQGCQEVQAIPIPNRATNGDMIKALFPNAEDIKVDGGYPLNYIIEGEWHRNLKDWWNAPYKAESEVV